MFGAPVTPASSQRSLFVPGRGACRFVLQSGQAAAIVDVEGQQSAFLFVKGTDGAI